MIKVCSVAATIMVIRSCRQCRVVLMQPDVSPNGKDRLAATAFPSTAMAQATSQRAAGCQSGVRDQVTGSNIRHIMPCSGHSPSGQLPQASQGVPTQPLFSAPQGCNPLRGGPEAVVDKGLRVHSGSESRGAGVRYCLSSSEPAVGAGIWEEQTTRYADLTAWFLDDRMPLGVIATFMIIAKSTTTAA